MAGWQQSAQTLGNRAIRLYSTMVIVAAVVYALKFVPVLDSNILRVWTDPISGVDYDLFPMHFRANPLEALQMLLFLQVTPWQFNIIGLYVFLIALSPLAIWMLRTGRGWLLISTSWLLYAVNSMLSLQITPCAFENSFPLLTWQLPYFYAVAAGYYRHELAAAVSGKRWFVRVHPQLPCCFWCCASMRGITPEEFASLFSNSGMGRA